jgi:putative transposase
MPVHRQKKDTTPPPPGSTQEQTTPTLPDQQTDPSVSQRIGESGPARGVGGCAALIGVGWGQSSPKRKGYRNGSYSRDLVTAGGPHRGDQRAARS